MVHPPLSRVAGQHPFPIIFVRFIANAPASVIAGSLSVAKANSRRVDFEKPPQLNDRPPSGAWNMPALPNGLGRIFFLKVFNNVSIESVFREKTKRINIPYVE
jgi:hypothetical protein